MSDDTSWGSRVGGWMASAAGWLLIGIALVFTMSLVSLVVSSEVETDSTAAYVILICGPLGGGWWLIRVGRRLRKGAQADHQGVASERDDGSGRKIAAALVGVAGLFGLTLLWMAVTSWVGDLLSLDQESSPHPLLITIPTLVALFALLGYPYLLISALFPASSEKNLARGSQGPAARWFESTAVALSRRERTVWVLYVGYVGGLFVLAGLIISVGNSST